MLFETSFPVLVICQSWNYIDVLPVALVIFIYLTFLVWCNSLKYKKKIETSNFSWLSFVFS